MRKNLIESYLEQLRASLGAVRRPVSEEKLRALYDAKDYAGLVGYIQRTLHLDMRVRLGLVNKGGPNAPAWVARQTPMPGYGTAAFRQLTVTIYIRKSFLQEGTFEEAVLASAHELCHIVLDAVGHPLHEKEEAVDLTAMLLGFRDFYVTGCYSERKKTYALPDCFFGQREEVYQIIRTGYLTPEEVSYAAQYMTFR